MIAADTSSLTAYLKGSSGRDVDRLAAAIDAGDLVLPPAVMTEILSDPSIDAYVEKQIAALELLPILENFWVRAGHARRLLKTKGLKAKIADALIAQACIDHDVVLITRDTDFRHFAKHCGLKLA